MEIVSRVQWDSRYPAGFGPAPTADEVWLHHSASASAGPDATLHEDILAIRALEAIGQQRFGGGISYTFVVMESGRIFEGTGPGRVGAHTAGRNTRARAICLNGNYQTRTPNGRMTVAVAALLRYGEGRTGYWHRGRLNGGHRDAPGAQTACPGDAAHALIPTINARAAGPEDDVTEDELKAAVRAVFVEMREEDKATVRVAISEMFDEAATRLTPTGRNFGNDLASILAVVRVDPVDPVVLAAELAPLLGEAADQATVEAALRNVLGSLKDA